GVRSFSGVAHIYLDNRTGGGSYPIAVTVITSDNELATASTSVTVTNVKPTIAGVTLSAPTINENDELTVRGVVADPAGVLDAPMVVITWGDGLVPVTTTVPATTAPGLPSGQVAFSATRRYLDDPGLGGQSGSYTISMVVTDKDGGTGT